MKSLLLLVLFVSSATLAQTRQNDFPLAIEAEVGQQLDVDVPKVCGIEEIEAIIAELKANPELE